jgi:RimJ/RimL family protein N-acetyltransferase
VERLDREHRLGAETISEVRQLARDVPARQVDEVESIEHGDRLRPKVPAVTGWSNLAPVLEGTLVRVEPLAAEHEPALWEAGQDPEVWRWMPVVASTSREHFHRWIEQMLEDTAAGRQASFVTTLRASGAPIGHTSYLALRPEHRGLEIGGTWLGSQWWRSGANIETKLLLLTHAFETLECIRVEFKTDELNERSRKALEGIGAKFEGIFRSHMIVRGDVIRDSAYYSVIAAEWPETRDWLARRLEQH